MKQEISESDFIQAFHRAGRGSSWTNAGLSCLYEMLEEQDPDYELDVIGLDCEYCEYSTALDAAKDNGFEPDYPEHTHIEDESDKTMEDFEEYGEQNEADALKWLYRETAVYEFDGGIIIQSF